MIDNDNGITHVGSKNELNATYSADGYSKLAGFGAAAVTFGVGSLSTVNALAGAYSDDTPVILICGAPTRQVMNENGAKLLHHTIKHEFDTSMNVMKEVTIKTLRLENLETAGSEIDELLMTAYNSKKPVYLEIPYDMQKAQIDAPKRKLNLEKKLSNEKALKEAVSESISLIEKANSISSVAGSLLQRNKSVDDGVKLVERLGSSAATIFTAKVTDLEDHPNAVGVYQGAMSEDYTKNMIEQTDLVIGLGFCYDEFDTGIFTAKAGEGEQNSIFIMNERVNINGNYHQDVYLKEFIPELLKELDRKNIKPKDLKIDKDASKFYFERNDNFKPTDEKLTIDRMFVQFGNFMNSGDTLFGDTGGWINGSQVNLKKNIDAYGCGNWGSLGAGFGMGAGAAFYPHKDENSKHVCITGDGAFFMSAQELSTVIEHDKNMVLIVLDNSGYGAERQIYPGKERSYNDFNAWNYEKLGEAFGGKEGENVNGYVAKTEAELDKIFKEVQDNKGVSIVRVMLDPWDTASFNVKFSEALRH